MGYSAASSAEAHFEPEARNSGSDVLDIQWSDDEQATPVRGELAGVSGPLAANFDMASSASGASVPGTPKSTPRGPELDDLYDMSWNQDLADTKEQESLKAAAARIITHVPMSGQTSRPPSPETPRYKPRRCNQAAQLGYDQEGSSPETAKINKAFPSGSTFATSVVQNASWVLFVTLGVCGVVTVLLSNFTCVRDGLALNPVHADGVLSDFPRTDFPVRDAFVMWCDQCNLMDDTHFRLRYETVTRTLVELRSTERCRDLEWSGFSSPAKGLAGSAYFSENNTASFVDFRFSDRRCAADLQKKLKALSGTLGKVTSAQGGQAAAAAASIQAEIRTSWCHALFAAPVCALILWMAVGNVYRALTPFLCVGLALFAGKAAAGISKAVLFPDLDLNFDDSLAIFVVMAMCIDYALFFWSRFNREREECPGVGSYKLAVATALRRSGTVILVSNCLVALAYACTMLLPNMNSWAYLGLYIECTIGCAAAALYSVTVTPALAVVCPQIFDRGRCPLDEWWSRLPRTEGLWRLWATRITTSRCLMVFLSLVAYAFMASLMYPLMQYSPSYDVEAMSLRGDMLESRALRHFEDDFNIGILHPVNLVLEAYKLPGSPSPSGRTEADASSEPQGPLRKRPIKLAQRAPSEARTQKEEEVDVNAGPKDPSGEPLPKEVQNLAEGSLNQPADEAVRSGLPPALLKGHTSAGPSFLQLEQRKAGSSQSRAGFQPALGAEGKPMTWQDMLYPEADPLSTPEQAAAKDIEGTLNLMKEHDYLARSPAALLKHDYPARCVEQKVYAESDRFKDGKDLVFSEQFGKEACSVIGALLSGSRGRPWQVRSDDVLSLWWMPRMPGRWIGLRSTGLLGAPTNMAGKVMRNELMVREMQDSVPDVLQQSVSHDGNKILLMVSSRFGPSSEEAHQLDSFVRRLEEKDVAHFELGGTRYGIKLRHQSSMQATVDAVGELQQAAIRMAAFFLPMIVLAIGVLFGSPFLAMKLMLTVVLPILSTYGVAIAVFQMNMLGWTGVKMLMGTGGLDYRLIFITGGVLFGFAMDYDLFLYTRIRELRSDGYDHESAVRLALTETGPVTTTAGMVMSLSFFSLAMAHTPSVRIMGFIFFVGTLLDVLVVRMLLAPFFLTVAGSKAYWPTEMPPATKTDETAPPKHA